MGDKNYSRRGFIIKNMGALAAFAGGAGLFASCGSGGTEDKAQQKEAKLTPKSCNDLSGISENEIQKRKKLSYVTETPVPGSDCGNCQFHIPGKYAEDIGGCLLFDGPVCPTGYCTQYAKAEK